MPRRDTNKPQVTRSKKLVPVVLQTNYRGRYSGATHGFPAAIATSLVNARCARFFDDEARQMAERLGFAAKADVEHAVDGEVAERAEQRASEIVAEMKVGMEEKMADIVAANKRGSAVVGKHKEEVAEKDAEIAQLKADLESATAPK